ncbi:MAG: choice-of-anchor J domain-containing protein, partial [Muribaculaceae bacterium]|nr:choice-of-anchor J domain-containing protein [Muribaculaceae bacterium]
MRKLNAFLTFAVAALAVSAQDAPRFVQNDDAPAQQPFLTVPQLPGAPVKHQAPMFGKSLEQSFNVTFISADKLDDFTIVDGNNDGKKFAFYDAERCLRLQAPTRGTGEDYLVLPAVDMRKNYSYGFSVDLCSATSKNSQVSLVVAKGKTLTALREAEVVVDLTVTDAVLPDWQTISGEYTCDEAGEYYFALKCTNTGSMSTLYVRQVDLAREMLKIEPCSPTNVTCVSAEDGSPVVTLTWEPPTEYWNNGGPITEPLFFDIWNDTKKQYVVHDIPAEYPVTTYVDTNPLMGDNTYVVIAKTARIEGGYSYTGCYVGFDIPADVIGHTSTQGNNTGMAYVTWTPVENDIHGRKILEPVYHDVYQLWSGGQAIAGQDLTGGSLKVQATQANAPQAFFTYVVFARTSKGRSDNYSYCEPLALGKPYELPYLESWTNRGISHPISTGTDAWASNWFTCGERTYNEFGPVDGDDGYTIFYAGSSTESPVSSLLLGLFHIDADAENPLFTIYTLAQWADPNYAPSYNYVTLDADLHDGNGYKPIGIFSTNAQELGVPDATWVGQSISLADLKGKDVHLRVTATNINYYVTAFDKMHIFDCTDYNASNVRISGPEQLTPGYPSTFTVLIDNYGKQPLTSKDYTVELLFNGEVVASKPGDEIPYMGMTGQVEFEWAPTCLNAVGMVTPKAKISARVVCEQDKSQADNASATIEIPIVATTWPTAQDLTANRETTTGVVTVAWDEPELIGLPLQRTLETFESYEMPSKTGFGDWTLYDGDGGPSSANRVGVSGVDKDEPLSFVVFNFSPANKQFYAHGGTHCIGAVYNYDRSAQQDWIISPELSGEKQTITFWAKSHPTQYSEMYQRYEKLTVVYSTTDANPESFDHALIVDATVPFEWTKMQVTVPEGALYFALVCTSEDTYILLIDDIEFTRGDAAPVDLQVNGYN